MSLKEPVTPDRLQCPRRRDWVLRDKIPLYPLIEDSRCQRTNVVDRGIAFSVLRHICEDARNHAGRDRTKLLSPQCRIKVVPVPLLIGRP